MTTTTSLNPLNSSYTFSSQPKVLEEQTQSKFRPSDELNPYGNLMFDRRVVRGNTYALRTLPAHAQADPIDVQRQEEAKRRAVARRKRREQLRRKTPEPLAGRKNIDVQTELYLQELSDRIEEIDVDVQTDAFLERPLSPFFVPRSTGQNISTQIEPGDLFDFDEEVKPIVETLVGKTIEQSLVEVAEEEELADLREQQRQYEERRNVEQVELQRLEEQERRLRKEKDRRMQQAEEALRLEQDVMEKLAARVFAKSYLQDLLPSVFKHLRENGFFYDPIEQEVEVSFLPWLMSKTMIEVKHLVLGRTILDAIIRETVQQRMDNYDKLEEILRQAAERELETRTSEIRSESVPEGFLQTNVNTPHEGIHSNELADEREDSQIIGDDGINELDP